MKRSTILILAIVLVVVLTSPALAFASKGDGKSNGNGKPAAAAAAAKNKSKDAPPHKADSKVKTPAKTHMPKSSVDASEAPEPPESTEATSTPGAGIGNAFTRITSNIEKALAKIEAGTKTQVPPGLIRVWLKFAGWLGIDASTMPGAESVPPTDEPTGTVEPTPTVEPVVVPAW